MKNGYLPVGVSRNPFQKDPSGLNIRFVDWENMRFEIEGAFAVINLAGESIRSELWTAAQKQKILESRVKAGEEIIYAIKKAEVKPRLVIQASAVGAYGDRGDSSIDETSRLGSGFLADVCKHWEASTDACDSFDIRRCIIRSGVVLGRGGFLSKISLPFNFFLGGPVGSGKQHISWIHIKDEIGVIMEMLENESMKGMYNLTAPNPVTNRQFEKTLGKVLGKPSFFHTPSFAVKLAAGELGRELILAGQKVLPKKLVAVGYQFRFPDLEPALRDVYGK
jgi:uncharacterized protein (TIGR01777 family)